MTSRFGKTYNRKGGEANSRFEEVFSNRKPTLSTKWGDTTYKAQLGAKRPVLQSDGDISKRPRLEDSDSDQDPFGFDSDDESKTVTSHISPETNASSPEVTNTPTKQSTVTPSVVTSSQISSTITSESHYIVAYQILNGKCGVLTMYFIPTDATNPEEKVIKVVVKSNQPWYKVASDGSQKSTTTSSISHTVSSANQNSGTQQFLFSSTDISPYGVQSTSASLSREFLAPSSCDEMTSVESEAASEPPPAPVDNIPPSPFTLRASNCKKYQRPNRSNKTSTESAENNNGSDPHETTSMHDKSLSAHPASSSSTSAKATTATKPAGRGAGRVRDYTVLHPSCVSICNVTIQDSIERSIDELVAPAAPADVGDVGQMKKKTDAPPPKHARYRPTPAKPKKTKTESKLEFFGFEEQGGNESSESATAGKSSYKIKYFGFDDLSESDSDDDSTSAKEKKATKALAALSSCVDSPQTNAFDFSDDLSPSGTETLKARLGKGSEKPKEFGAGAKKIFSGPKKSPAKAVYNARHWNQPEPDEIPAPPLSRSQTAVLSSSNSKDSNSHKDDGLFKAPPPPPKDIVTALKCRKEHKELYTVVQHVKHFNDVVEFGENQEFTDDFEYLETGLKSSQPLNTRCLSIISLATRCAMPSFRMHLRARGKVAHVFKILSDAPQHPNLALCTASLMYILSRDRLNMDLDRACLELMIKLLEMEQDYSALPDQLTAKEEDKVKEKIRKLCETVHNKHLDLENITTGHLAMETLLSLTSKRAGDWFKEELRLLGGLDHIVDKVKECVQHLSHEEDKENLVASLWGAERCLRVLESVTVQNSENQGYLIAYKDSQLIISSARALRHCENMIQRYSRALNNTSVSSTDATLPHCSFSNVGKAVEDCMRAVIGVLLNLTHDNEWGSTKTGEQELLIVTALNCVLRVPRYIPQEQRFDIRVLGLGLLINLVEYSSRNRHCLVDMEYTECYKGNLMHSEHALFLERERAAILAEAKTDDIITEAPKPALDQSGEWQETSGEIQWVEAENTDKTTAAESDKKEEEDEELDLNKALQHAGKHMEDSIAASYTALLLGCLCQGSQVNVTTVRENLPKGDFSIMTEMLKKFLNFMNLTCAMGSTGQKSISRVIDYLEHC
uniref:Wings apart-like protein homolog n=1 Tax=Neogobius melanostomus TaxID=47308 RepID=A0A8C6WJS6_9GOBI